MRVEPAIEFDDIVADLTQAEIMTLCLDRVVGRRIGLAFFDQRVVHVTNRLERRHNIADLLRRFALTSLDELTDRTASSDTYIYIRDSIQSISKVSNNQREKNLKYLCC